VTRGSERGLKKMKTTSDQERGRRGKKRARVARGSPRKRTFRRKYQKLGDGIKFIGPGRGYEKNGPRDQVSQEVQKTKKTGTRRVKKDRRGDRIAQRQDRSSTGVRGESSGIALQRGGSLTGEDGGKENRIGGKKPLTEGRTIF